MIKKTVTYLDFNDEEVTEDFYFHLSKAELVELELNTEGGLKDTLTKIVETEDNREIWNYFKKFILISYGKKSEDGRNFLKSTSLREEFESTNAFDTLIMSLLENADTEGTEFFNAIMPREVVEEAAKIAETQENAKPVPLQPGEVGFEPRVLTTKEIVEMEDAELRSGLAEGRYKLAE